MAIFNSNGSIYNFNIHKMSKAYTWNEHLLSIQNENLQVKSAIL